MIILSLRSDKPEAEIGLYDNQEKLYGANWEAHRQLAETIHNKIKNLLENAKMNWSDIEGIVVFEGPGSFTGLRIGLSVANSLAYANSVPIVGGSGEEWLVAGLSDLINGKASKSIMPVYGSPVHITEPKK